MPLFRTLSTMRKIQESRYSTYDWIIDDELEISCYCYGYVWLLIIYIGNNLSSVEDVLESTLVSNKVKQDILFNLDISTSASCGDSSPLFNFIIICLTPVFSSGQTSCSICKEHLQFVA